MGQGRMQVCAGQARSIRMRHGNVATNIVGVTKGKNGKGESPYVVCGAGSTLEHGERRGCHHTACDKQGAKMEASCAALYEEPGMILRAPCEFSLAPSLGRRDMGVGRCAAAFLGGRRTRLGRCAAAFRRWGGRGTAADAGHATLPLSFFKLLQGEAAAR
eukprot:gene13406-biopygen3959